MSKLNEDQKIYAFLDGKHSYQKISNSELLQKVFHGKLDELAEGMYPDYPEIFKKGYQDFNVKKEEREATFQELWSRISTSGNHRAP